MPNLPKARRAPALISAASISAALMSAALSLAGCAASTDRIFDTSAAPTMLEIYEGHLARQSGKDYLARQEREGHLARQGRAAPTTDPRSMPVAPPCADGDDAHPAGFSQDAARRIEALFPTLPNPVLVMYVPAHLAGAEGMPVPGYATAFTLYDKTHFAAPGEARASRIGDDALCGARPIEAALPAERRAP